jgi:hypothetical protein
MKAIADINKSQQIDADYLVSKLPAGAGVEGRRALNYKPYRVPKMPHHANPKPRQDKTTVDTLSRLFTLLQTAQSKLPDYKNYKSAIGQKHGSFYLAATDGGRALMLPNDGALHPPAQCDLTETGMPGRSDILLDTPELFCAVKRALTCSPKSDKIEMHILCGGLILKSRIEGECEFEEAVQGMSDPFNSDYPKLTEIFADSLTTVLAIDGKYLLDVLGSWPLRMSYSKDGNRVVFAPMDDSFRYVIALLGGGR